MNASPQPGDRWTLHGEPDIEVVAIKSGDVYYTSGKTPLRLKLDDFERLAKGSILRGAVLRRGGEVFSKDLEDFEV